MPLTYVPSQRGELQLLDRGFLYAKERPSPNGLKIYWKCIYEPQKCKGRVHTQDEEVVYRTKNHKCDSRSETPAVKRTIDQVKEMAKTSDSPPSKIIAQAVRNLPDSVSINLPNNSALRQVVHRARTKSSSIPPLPRDLASLQIPDPYDKTSANDKFLYYDNNSERRILMFTTLRNLNDLASNSEWACDGTFKCVPLLFEQLWTLHCKIEDRFEPKVFVLMSDRRRTSYTAVLTQLASLASLTPTSIMSDFEQAQMDSFPTVFSQIRNKGCYFHFKQAFLRFVKSNKDLYQLYRDTDEPNFQVYIQLFATLAFVPLPDVVNAYNELIGSKFIMDNLIAFQSLLSYFERTWIGAPHSTRGNGYRRPALYSLDRWNHYDSIINDEHKTNNHIEGWNRSFSDGMPGDHPNIWNFINHLKDEQQLMDQAANTSHRANPPYRRKQDVARLKRLKELVENYDPTNQLKFLKQARSLSYFSI